MYNLIETLLLNILFLLFPIVIILIFFENKFYSINKFVFLALSSTTMVLCMTHPIQLESGFIIDLRYIPFIIVALYGGYKMTFPLYLVLNVARFIIGGNGFIQSLLFSTIVFICIPLFHKWFIKQNAKKKIINATFFSLITIVFYLFTLSFQMKINMEFWSLTLHSFITYVLMMSMIMILIEQIIRNIQARDKFIYSEKLNVVSELSASVAHEIRNPLTVTNGFLQLLNESTTITQADKRYIECSLQELRRAEKIVSDFLAFSKPQSENMVHSNFKNEIEYVTNIMIPYANLYHVDLQFTFNNSIHKTYDKNQVQQCLINLCKNGIEAMKDSGGTLYIDIFEKGNQIIIKIKDTGIGMTKEEILHLSKPYYSTKKEGTGLGMLMVYSTIHKMKGKIEVESKKGKGTTFLIKIPV